VEEQKLNIRPTRLSEANDETTDWLFFKSNNIFKNACEVISSYTYNEDGLDGQDKLEGQIGNGESIVSLLVKLHAKLEAGVIKIVRFPKNYAKYHFQKEQFFYFSKISRDTLGIS